MKVPDLDNLVETFIPVAFSTDSPWNDYADIVRTKVKGTISKLTAQGIIGWWSFLRHDHSSGVPTNLIDGPEWIHLRLESLCTQEELISAIPEFCLRPRVMPGPDRRSLDAIKASDLLASDVSLAWWRLGCSSEFFLDSLCMFPPDRPVPVSALRQIFHYSFNQFAAFALGFRE